MALCGRARRARAQRRGVAAACLRGRPRVALLACCAALADGRCAQRGLSKFVILPSGRSHLASLFGMSCISALLLGLLQRWCSLFVAQRWRNRCCTVSVVVLSTSCTNSVSRALLQVFFVKGELLASVLQTLAYLVHDTKRPLQSRSADKIRQYRRHGFLLRCSAARDGSEVRGVPGL